MVAAGSVGVVGVEAGGIVAVGSIRVTSEADCVDGRD
jgi:hypothetical protein